MVKHLASLLEIIGIGCVATGAFQVAVWLGWVVIGVGLIALALSLDLNAEATPS